MIFALMIFLVFSSLLFELQKIHRGDFVFIPKGYGLIISFFCIVIAESKPIYQPILNKWFSDFKRRVRSDI